MEEFIFDDFYTDVEEILGNKATEEQKREIAESLWLIFQDEMNIIKNSSMRNNQFYKNNFQLPCINLYIVPFYTPLSPIQPLNIQQPMIQQPLKQYMAQQPILPPQTFPIGNYFPMQFNQQLNFNTTSKFKQSKRKNKKQKKNDKKEKKHKNTEKKQKSKEEKKIVLTEKEFDVRPGSNFDGIMRYLTRETKGNIHDNGTVSITSNSVSSGGDPKNLVNYEDESRYQSIMHGNGNAYIRFDFKDMTIQLTKYTIQSNSCIGKDWYDLRNWVIEVSDDGLKWEEIDRHVDDPSLNGHNIVFTFNVQKPNNGFHRFVQLRQTGVTWSRPSDKYHFFFCFLEFYGKIKIPQGKFEK